MIIKDSFYVARHSDDAYRAKFVAAASTLEYISHKVFEPDRFDQKFFAIKCILNKDEEIILRVKNHIGSSNYQLTNCSFFDDKKKGYVYWKDLFIDSFKSFLKTKEKIDNCSV